MFDFSDLSSSSVSTLSLRASMDCIHDSDVVDSSSFYGSLDLIHNLLLIDGSSIRPLSISSCRAYRRFYYWGRTLKPATVSNLLEDFPLRFNK
ncbi:hypothetical protein FRX31_010118 [Thalictrum thalictroides]|uniref:Uncharacterized protein n=1 Tax=Thalictrum thalictroides TaxID=46969 RepID=A0A7J6WSE8_THATH|nr:hypothetical protein FRX31_010118 [Thalictrum thalictroides]